LRCDGTYDCADYTDEIGCTTTTMLTTTKFICPLGELRCGNIDQCFKKAYLCNQVRDCDDNTDEIGCVYTTPPTAPPANKNNDDDATNGQSTLPSATAKPACTAVQWQCNNGDCIRDSLRCDFFIDCADSSDEVLCTTTAKALTDAPTAATVPITGAPITLPDGEPVTDTNGVQLTNTPATAAPTVAPTVAPVTAAPVTGAPITALNGDPVTNGNGVQLTATPVTTSRKPTTTATTKTATTITTTTPVVLTLYFRTPPPTTTTVPLTDAALTNDGSGDDLGVDGAEGSGESGDADTRSRRELAQRETAQWEQAVSVMLVGVEALALDASSFDVVISQDPSSPYEVTAVVTGLTASDRDALTSLVADERLTAVVDGRSYSAFSWSFYQTTTKPTAVQSFGIPDRETKVIRVGVIVGCVIGGFVLGGIMLMGAQCVGRSQDDFDVASATK
jgi:hypothetical protein